MSNTRGLQSALSHELHQSLQKLLRCLDIGKNTRGKAPPLTVTQMRVLSFFNTSDVLHISEISPVLRMSLQSLNNVVQRLEAAGYVKRAPNKDNRRFSDLTLSSKGRQCLDAFRTDKVLFLEQMLAHLLPKEQKRLQASLQEAAAILEKGIMQLYASNRAKKDVRR